MASSITRFVTFLVYRFLMDFPTGFPSMTRFVAVVIPYSSFSSYLLWLMKDQLASASTMIDVEFSSDPSPPFFLSMTLLQLSSLLNSGKTSLIGGRHYRPIILPLTSSNSIFRPARNLKIRLISTIFNI